MLSAQELVSILLPSDNNSEISNSKISIDDEEEHILLLI